MVEFRGGRLPNDMSKPRLRLKQHLVPRARRVTPERVDRMSRIVNWPMYSNDRYGCCVWATIGHQVQSFTAYAHGEPVTISEVDILRAYSTVTGFDPRDPSTDRGTVIQHALNYWRKTGVAGHGILAFAEVDPLDREEVEAAIYIFGNLHLGISFPASAMQQFNMHQAWDVVDNDGGDMGGHAIANAAYDREDDTYRVVTWARDVTMTDEFWRRYVDEAWVVISPEWLDASGHTPEGVDLYGLGEEFSQLTGLNNPFPGPKPTPDNGPGPDVGTETVTAADEDLAEIARTWVRKRRHGDNNQLAKALRLWLERKDLEGRKS